MATEIDISEQFSFSLKVVIYARIFDQSEARHTFYYQLLNTNNYVSLASRST
jgi:hypothetical protein